jgi:hypothetical protein
MRDAIVGEFAKLRKATIVVSHRPHGTTWPHLQGLSLNFTFETVTKYDYEIQVCLKTDKNTKPKHMYDVSLNSS